VTAPPDDDAHLSLDALADLDEGLSDDAEQAQSAHVESCPTCQRRRARLRATRALLSTLPPEPMPQEVGDRIDAALATVPPLASVIPTLPRTRRWRTKPTLAGLSAAAAVAALVAALVIGVTHNGGNKNSTTGTSAAGAGSEQNKVRTVVPTTSGRNYNKGNIVSAVEQQLALRSDSASGAGAGPAESTPSPAAPKASTVAPAFPPALARLRNNPRAFVSCLLALTENTVVRPLLVDYARWKNKPAVVFVLPGLRLGHEDIWVVGAGCGPNDAQVLFYNSFVASG